jgi:hypothetical protein
MRPLDYRRPEPETKAEPELPLHWHLILATSSVVAFWLFLQLIDPIRWLLRLW